MVFRQGLGEATFRSEIKRELGACHPNIPPIYNMLWKIKPNGFLSLNLDGFGARSFSAVWPSKKITEFSGFEANKFTHILQATYHPFCANLHGKLEDHSSWVFTERSRKALFSNVGYSNFIHTSFSSKVAIFIGITANDVMAGGHLERMRLEGISIGNHFWITDKSDLKADNWAEKSGIQIIRYANPDGRHAELEKILDDLASFSSRDETPSPVIPTLGANPIAPSELPENLTGMSYEQIRQLLNSKAAELLTKPAQPLNDEYAKFLKKYDPSIYQAWYITEDPPNNILFGYELISQIAEGGFGKVYRAKGVSGDQVAIKVLHQELRKTPDVLDSFRRGVNSMNILSSKSIEGTVPYIATSEIPACAVMKFVEGPNLHEAVESRHIEEWVDILKIGRELSAIILKAHTLPERVLHRDIRPANIMLEGFYTNPEDWKLVVLDFDLSWHRDATGNTFDRGKSSNGYLAPEQYGQKHIRNTRNALVDSFGLGMTLFYIATAREPQFLEHNHTTWKDTLDLEIGRKRCLRWNSLPKRYARLVQNATLDDQASRWDMTSINAELSQLHSAATTSNPESLSPEMIAEELASRADVSSAYEWNDDYQCAEYKLPSGIHIGIRPVPEFEEIQVRVHWTDSGNVTRKNIGKYIYDAKLGIESKLASCGFKTKVNSTQGQLDISGSASYRSVARAIDAVAKAISDIAGLLKFQ